MIHLSRRQTKNIIEFKDQRTLDDALARACKNLGWPAPGLAVKPAPFFYDDPDEDTADQDEETTTVRPNDDDITLVDP